VRNSARLICQLSLLTLLWLSALAQVEAAGARRQIKLSFRPAHLILGQHKKGSIRVTLPERAEAPVIETSIGAIENIRQLGPRHWGADYIPPKPTYPQVAIISVTCHCPERGVVRTWRALPLWGAGDAVVKTDPGARVTVKIGDRSFGPSRANAEGIALVPIVVPPGVQVGMAGDREIDLGVPETKLIILSLDRQRAPADQEVQVAARSFVIDEAGEPRTDVSMELSASYGAVSAVAAASPGEFVATWTLPPGPARAEKLTGKIPGEEKSTSIAKLQRDPGPPVGLLLTLEPPRAVAGETTEVALIATAVDAADNPTPSVIAFAPEQGDPLEIDEPEPGRVRARYLVPSVFAGKRSLRYSARLGSGGVAEASVDLPLLAAAPAELRLDELAAEEASPRKLRAQVHDRFGNPVEDAQLEASAEHGAIEAVRPEQPGAYLLDYSPPWYGDARQTRVDVRAGEASASRVLALSPRSTYSHLGLKLGYLGDLGNNGSAILAGELGGWYPFGAQALGLELELGYFWFDHDYPVDSGPLAGQSVLGSNRFVPLLASLGWRYKLLRSFYLWAQVGMGATYVWTELRIPDQPATSAGAWALTGAGTFSAGWRVGPGALFGEARYWILGDPGLENLRGGLPAWMGAVGYRLELL
jgi:hypothetical protein